MCSLKGYGFNLEAFLKFNDPRTFPRIRDVLPGLFSSPSLENVTRPSTPDEDILSQSSSSTPRQCTPDQDVPSQSDPSSPREESNQCTPDQDVPAQSVPVSPREKSNQSTPDQDVPSQSVPASPREESNQCTPDQDVPSQSDPSSPREESNQSTPDQDVPSQSVPSSPREEPNQCTTDQDVPSQSVPASPREESNQCTPDQDVPSQSVPSSPIQESNQCTPDEEVSSQSVPPSFRNVSGLDTSNLSESCSYESCPALIQTERLDKNLTSSSLQTMCDEGTATKGHVVDSWLHSWRKNIHSRDAWDTAVKHSSKPTINSAIAWTDEELISIEESLSGFSTGPQPVAATVMFYILCVVLCVLTVTGTILLHSSLTTEAALWWLVCVTVGVVFHVLVLEPIKAVLILAYASTTTKKLY